MSALLFLVILGLCYCSKDAILGPPVLHGPKVAFIGQIIEFQCEVQIFPKNETILLQIFKDNDTATVFAEYPTKDGKGSLPKVIKQSHEGYLECMASVDNNTLIQPTFSHRHYLKVIERVREAKIAVLSGSVTFFEGETLKLSCKVSAGTDVAYRWSLNGEPVSQPPVQNELVINSTTSQDSGSYMCVATNQLNETMVFTSSSSVRIRVKEVVSNPDISYTMIKEDSHNYSAMVLCESSKGTPMITFSLYNGTESVANVTVEEPRTTFKLPVVLGQHLLQCQADNGDHIGKSRWMALEFVPFGGPVELEYNYDIGEDFAVIGVTFYCKAAKGTHLQYQWFLNKTVLEGRGSFYWVVDQPPEQSILVLSVGSSSAGTYYCEVSESFDNTTVIRSRKRYIDKTVLNHLHITAVAVVFGFFVAIIATVSACCCVGVVFRRMHYGKKSLWDLDMIGMATDYEDKLDFTEYSEDADVVKAARVDDFDQVSEASVDEWPQIAEEKKTLEDELVEEP